MAEPDANLYGLQHCIKVLLQLKQWDRYAFNAAVAASHMAEHYLRYCKLHHQSQVISFRTLDEYRNHVSDRTKGAFRDIRYITEAYKHLYPNDPRSSIASTGAIESITITGAGIAKIYQDFAGDSPSRGIVRYSAKTGQQYDFQTRLQKVIDYWEAEIGQLR